MNERIRELADKIWAEEYWTNPNTDKLLPAQLNKFAELIVRECADIAIKSGNVANKNIAARIESERIYHKIMDHFGVEQ